MAQKLRDELRGLSIRLKGVESSLILGISNKPRSAAKEDNYWDF